MFGAGVARSSVSDGANYSDTARLVQRLIELEKDSEVMLHPVEHHTVATELSRCHLVGRSAAFFDRWLRAG